MYYIIDHDGNFGNHREYLQNKAVIANQLAKQDLQKTWMTVLGQNANYKIKRL